MKKMRMAFTCLLLVVLMISGCSSGSSSNENVKTLTLWYWNRSIDDNLIQSVQKQFPGIRINAQKIGGDFKSKLKTTLAAAPADRTS
ncbi:hypothetical protein VQ056_32990 [Paenibacillus sp. JTLBN-2024]